MTLDANVVALSASSVYRVLKNAGVMRPLSGRPITQGQRCHRLDRPERPHQDWHVSVPNSLFVAEIDIPVSPYQFPIRLIRIPIGRRLSVLISSAGKKDP